jgi:hypothetical protein
MAIEIRQTKRALVYRVVIPAREGGPDKVVKTFRSKAAAEAWERETLAERERPRSSGG